MDLGMSVLYPGENVENNKDIKLDIVAIHGLDGHRTATWTHSNANIFWLQDLLPGNVQNARIMTFGYDADVFFSRTTSDIDDHGSSLLANLIDVREANEEKQRPIIFIAHSLGGIILKKALIQSFQEPRYDSVHKLTVGIIFLGTPHQGTDAAEYTNILTNMAQRILHKPNPKVTLDALKRNCAFLLQLSKDFRHQISKYIIVSYYERKPLKTGLPLVSNLLMDKSDGEAEHSDDFLVVKIVEKHSALLHIEKEEQLPVDADHQEMCKFASSNDVTYKQICIRIKRMMEVYEEDQRAAQFRDAAISNVHYNVPFHVSPDFIGRGDILCRMEKLCLPTGPQHSQLVQKRFVLFGLGGCGKTQVCLKFAQDYRERFWGVFFIDASADNLADSGFRDIADSCDLGECDTPRTMRWLSNRKDPWLLILDNADNPGMELSKYFPGGARGTILITTRNRDFEKYATVGSNELECMDLLDAASLLLKASKSKDPESDTSKALATQIAGTLGCLALGIVHAAALIRQRVCGLEDYIEVFSKHRRRLLLNSSGPLSRHECDVYATWNVSWEAIQKLGNTVSTIALELLNIFACFHFGEISEKIFSSALKWKLGRDHRSLSAEWFGGMLERLRLYDGVSQAWEPLRFREAVSLLCAFSLVSYDIDESRLSLHPLVHAWARDRLGGEEFAAWSTKSLTILTASIATAEPSYRTERQLLAHLDACSQKSGDLNSLDDDDLKTRLAAEYPCVKLYQSHYQIHKAHDLAFRAVKLSAERWTYWNIFTLCSMRVLADQFQAMGEIERALKSYRDIAGFVEKMPPQEFPEEILELELLEQRGCCYYALDRFDTAVKCQELVLEMRVKENGKENHRTVDSMATLVEYYRNIGRKKECVELGEEVFFLSRKVRGEHHFGTLSSARGLAQDYNEAGEVSKSVDLRQWLSIACLSPDAPKTSKNLRVLHMLVLDFYKLGQKDKGRDLAAILASSSAETLGQEHPQTRKRFQMIDCFDFWAQVNADAAEDDKPISPTLLDRIAVMSSDFIQPHDQEVDNRNQKSINNIREDLVKWKPNRQDNASARERILNWLKIQESNFIVPKVFLEFAPKVESTMHILEGEPLHEEIREALGPDVYDDLERSLAAELDWNAEPERDNDDDGRIWFSKVAIAKWLAD